MAQTPKILCPKICHPSRDFEHTTLCKSKRRQNNLMKALIKKYAEEGLWLEDVPTPEIKGNEVLIKIHKTAILSQK